jgi:hypothetical protein
MNTVVGIVLLVVVIGVVRWYQAWLSDGIRPRTIYTSLSPTEVTNLFVGNVATHGWQVVEQGNPVVAQSSLLTGLRQQIGLHFEQAEDGRTVAEVKPYRYVHKLFGNPTKAHTLRWRINAFVRGVQYVDPGAVVRG